MGDKSRRSECSITIRTSAISTSEVKDSEYDNETQV